MLIAAVVSTAVAVAIAACSVECRHWFVLPVVICGTLIGIDAVDWCLGRVGRFDPVGIVGLLGWHFFFLAPLLQVAWDYGMPYVVPPSDWREWLGGMAWLNALGLVLFRLPRTLVASSDPELTERRVWVIDTGRFFPVVGIVLAVTAALQAWVYVQHGGMVAYMEAATDVRQRNAMQGWGIVFMISESFPILAVMALAVYARRRASWQSWSVLIPALAIAVVLFLLFGGLRGSRANTIWGLFWAAGIVHFCIRPLPKRLIAAGCAFLMVFMYGYGFFKGAGLSALEATGDAEVAEELSARTGRNLETLLLGDLSRADIQAFLLYRIWRPESDYEYALGRTYVGAVAILVPRALWPDRPPIKTQEGTEVQYGRGTFAPETSESSRVYGLAGEAMLNFGPGAVPFAYLILGAAVVWVRRLPRTLAPDDSRLLLVPFLVNFCFMILVSDLDNLIFNLIKNMTLPFLIVAVCSTRSVRGNAESEAGTTW